MREETQRAHTVVESDHDKALFRETLTVINWHGGGALHESTAINMHKDGPPFRRRFRGSKDIEIETILADLVVSHELIRPRTKLLQNLLNATCRELVRLEHPWPGHNRLRRTPPEVAARRRGERDSFIGEDRRVFAGNARDPAAGYFDCLSMRNNREKKKSSKGKNDGAEESIPHWIYSRSGFYQAPHLPVVTLDLAARPAAPR